VRRIALVLGILLSGCGGPYRRSERAERVEMGLYTVDPQVPWNMSTNKIWQSWTLDGFVLDELSFVNGLKDGQALYPRLQRRENPPVFRSSMQAEDVAIFWTSSLELMGAKRLKRSEPKPQALGSLAGHRIEVEYVDSEDLEYLGIVAWVVHDQRLYLIDYRATKEYYFAKHKDMVERLIASIRPSR
jgi:hypothetical protein